MIIPQGFPLMIHPVTDSAELYLVVGWQDDAVGGYYIPIVVPVGGRAKNELSLYDGTPWRVADSTVTS